MSIRASFLQGLALAGLTLALVLGVAVKAQQSRDTPLDQSLANLAAAKARWDQASLRHYRVLLQRMHVTGSCMQEVDVSSGKIVSVIRNECESAPMTVQGYFDHIHQQIMNSRCPDTKCKCLVGYRVDMTYAASGDYPRTIRLVADRYQANVDSDDFWQREALGLDPLTCTAAMVFATSPVTILDIRPRPD